MAKTDREQNRLSATRLAVYGSLAPGEVNHHHLADLVGAWQSGTVRGRLIPHGWGDGLGFPALIWDQTADAVEVQLFTSEDLPAHWSRLDTFEGDQYRRILVSVELTDGRCVMANIYVAEETTG